MPTEQTNFGELVNKPCSISSKDSFEMVLQFKQAMRDRERSTSRSSISTHSSIIDPGDEKSEMSFDEKSCESPNKRICNEYAKVSFESSNKEICNKKMSTKSLTPDISPEKCKPLRSFLIKDILSHNPENDTDGVDIKSDNRGFIRPWDIDSTQTNYINQLNVATSLFQSLQYNAITSLHPSLDLFQNHYQSTLKNYRIVPNRRPRSADDDSRSERSESPESPASNSGNNTVSSPLDALFEMTNKAFDRTDSSDKSSDPSSDNINLFNSRASQIKKKRKSRTAFTNHQIFELEKRFLYQKYLSPADRDEIAQSLGLTNAQVITWFQNRRAKLKRDVEELKKDVDAAKISSVHNSLLDNIQDLSLLKKTEIVAALHQHAQQQQQQQQQHHHHQQQQHVGN